VLSDPQKRQRYDQYGVDALREGGGMPGGVSPEDIFEAFFNSHGGGGFVQTGGLGGFHSVRFGTGGLGSANFVHFSTGGPRMRRGPAASRERKEAEEEPAQLPAWMRHLQGVGSALGPLLPFAVMALFALMLVLMASIAQFIMTRGFVIFPILYLTEGRTKLVLLAVVVPFVWSSTAISVSVLPLAISRQPAV